MHLCHIKRAALKLTGLLPIAIFSQSVSAVELSIFSTNVPPVDFHGFASQGFIVNSGNNNYLGGNSSQGTFDFREYGVNGSIAYDKWRVGAQIFGQELGQYGNDDIGLDWGNVDFQAFQWLGIRAGRVKTPRGLYNEALDLDSTRPFVLLPQSVYDARLRDFNSSFDGGMVYGNIDLHKAGSLDYRFYYGHIDLSTSSGANDYFNNDFALANSDIKMNSTFGGSLFWNTPLQGLRAGYSYQAFQDFKADRYVYNGLTMERRTPLYERHLISAEYTYGKWVFAAEAGMDIADYDLGRDWGLDMGQNFEGKYAYVSVARRISKRLELGAYYAYSNEVLNGVASYDYRQGDAAISARYDFTDYLLGKLEVHYMDGAGKLFDTAADPQPMSERDDSWVLFAAKVTFTF